VLKVIDNLRSVGLRPFIELGFMPWQLASGTNSVFWWNLRVTLPANGIKLIELLPGKDYSREYEGLRHTETTA
jgi:xylan 1,4-beta-xylosidase